MLLLICENIYLFPNIFNLIFQNLLLISLGIFRLRIFYFVEEKIFLRGFVIFKKKNHPRANSIIPTNRKKKLAMY